MTDILLPWKDKDPLSLQEAAYMWVGIPPNLSRRTLRDKYPEQMACAQEIKRQIIAKAESCELEHDRPVVTRRVTKQIPNYSGCDEWGVVTNTSAISKPTRPAPCLGNRRPFRVPH